MKPTLRRASAHAGAAVVLLALLGVHSGAAGPSDIQRGPARQTVSIAPTTAAPGVRRPADVRALAAAYLGRDEPQVALGEAEPVEFWDESPFGEDYEGRVLWSVRATGVRIARTERPDSAVVNVTLILDEAGRLQCAFTDPKVEWVVSADGSYEDVETKARKNRMAARPLREDERCESSVADVLGALWSRRGIDPSEPGQLVLRPRFVSRGLPAKEVDGEWVPVPLPGPYWLAEIRGMITLIKYGHYYSGQLVAMDDDLGRQDSQGTYMP